MAKNSTAKATIEVTTNATKAKNDIEAVNNLLKKLQNTKQLMMKEGLAFDKDGKETATFKKLNQDIKTATQALKDNTSAQEKMKATLNDLGNIRLKDLKRRYRELSKELGNFSGKEKAAAEQWRNDLAKIKAQITQIEGTTNSANKSMLGFGGSLKTTLKNLVAYAGVFAMFNRLKGLMEDIVQKNREMSDQLANIRKVSNLAMSDINELTNRLAKIDTRSSIQELNDLAYVGSKLGFGGMGIDALEGFVKSALKVNNALKEDLGEDSMMAISKLVEVMGLIPKMGVEKAMDSAGSAIFKLASTSTATGANIIEFSKRLMGLANVSHITTDQLLALGSASDAMGLMPEVSATAFNKVFTNVQSNTHAIEKSLDMTKGTLTELINQGKTMEAIVTVFDKMHGMNMDELKAKGVFKALGSDGARLNNVMITMSDRIDMLKTHLKTSNQAFTEGTAVAQEYAIQMETAEAYMQRASNMFTKAFVNPEGVDLTKEFAKAWYDFAKALTQGNGNAIAIQITLKSLFGILKLIVEMLPAIIAGFSAWGVWAGGAFLITQLKQIGTLITTIGAGIKAMSLAGLAGIFTGVAVAAYTLYQHFRELNGELQKNAGFMNGFKHNMAELNAQFGAAVSEAARYRNAIDQATTGTKRRSAAIAEFNNKFGGYLKNMLTEKSTALEVAKAYNEVTKALRAKLALQLKEKDIQEQVIPRESWTAQRREEYVKSVEGTQYSQYGRDWITAFAEENRGRSFGEVAKEIGRIFNVTAKEVANMIPDINKSQEQFKNLYTKQQWMVRNAMRYIAQDRSARNAAKKVDEKWAPEQKAIDDYVTSQTPPETPITPIDETRLTKEELAELRKQESAAKQAMRKEMEDMQKESTGIISKLEEYYRLQETAITEARADGKITEDHANEMIRSLNILKNESLAAARRAITTGQTKEWDNIKNNVLPAVLSDTSDVSKNLLGTIIDVEVETLHKSLSNFNGGDKVFGLSSGAFFDQMNAKAAGNKREAARLKAKIANEIEKALLQYNYVDQAQKVMRKDLETMGFITETYEQWAERMRNGIEEKPDTRINARENDIAAIFDAFGAKYSQYMSLNNEDANSMIEWFKEFTDEGKAKWAVGLPSISDWLKDANSHLPEIKQFYDMLFKAQTTAKMRSHAEEFSIASLFTTEDADFINQAFGRSISDEEAYRQMGNKFIRQGVINFEYNIDNEEEAMAWVSRFATNAKGELEDWAQAFPQLVEWIDLIKRKESGETLGDAELESLTNAMPQIRNLFNELINHSDRVNKAIKDAYQHEKTQQEIRFRVAGYSDEEKRTDKAIEARGQEKNAGIGATFWEQQELGSIANDPEILRIQNRIFWRNKEVEDARARLDHLKEIQDEELQSLIDKNASEEQIEALRMQQKQDRAGLEELLNERQTNLINETRNLTVSIAQQMQKRVDSIQNFVKPITTFTQAAGRKIGDMIFNMESEEATWEELWKNMALAVGEAVIEMGAQYMQNYLMQQSINRASEAEEAAHATTQTAMGIAAGSAKTIGQLGWWGIPLVAVIAALLTGLLQAALSTNRSSKSNTAAKTNIKLASGMLTYDEGNLGAYAKGQMINDKGQSRRKLYDDGTTQVYDREGTRPAPFVGQDGHVYMATPRGSIPEGVSLVKQPIATTVNGQPSLVAEKGPEIVIGRRTTARIMMNEPRLLHHLATLGNGRSYGGYRGLRTFDEGNLSVISGEGPGVRDNQTSPDSRDDRVAAALEQNAAAMAAFSQVMQQIQANGIQGVFREYGAGSLDESMRKVNAFRKRYPVG